jgi:hypothetical protein
VNWFGWALEAKRAAGSAFWAFSRIKVKSGSHVYRFGGVFLSYPLQPYPTKQPYCIWSVFGAAARLTTTITVDILGWCVVVAWASYYTELLVFC